MASELKKTCRRKAHTPTTMPTRNIIAHRSHTRCSGCVFSHVRYCWLSCDW